MRERWLDGVRAIAIFAVVMQHCQGWLGHSNIIQSFTLFCVSVLIICMGYTMRLGLENSIKKGVFKKNKVYSYIFKRMMPVLGSYCIASIAYLTYNYSQWGGENLVTLIYYLESFSASGPFYFIRHFINLSLIAPILFFVIKNIENSRNTVLMYILLTIFSLICLWIGYISIGKAEYTGESYLFLYVIGMLFAGVKKLKDKRKWFGFIGIFLTCFGYYSTYKFYMSRMQEENYSYSEGIDALMPNLQLNPPNISVLMFSLGVFCILASFFWYLENCNSGLVKIMDVFSLIGMYSLDVFLWHLFILTIITTYVKCVLINKIVAHVILYITLIGIPVFGRLLYLRIKQKMYVILTNED